MDGVEGRVETILIVLMSDQLATSTNTAAAAAAALTPSLLLLHSMYSIYSYYLLSENCL